MHKEHTRLSVKRSSSFLAMKMYSRHQKKHRARNMCLYCQSQFWAVKINILKSKGNILHKMGLYENKILSLVQNIFVTLYTHKSEKHISFGKQEKGYSERVISKERRKGRRQAPWDGVYFTWLFYFDTGFRSPSKPNLRSISRANTLTTTALQLSLPHPGPKFHPCHT